MSQLYPAVTDFSVTGALVVTEGISVVEQKKQASETENAEGDSITEAGESSHPCTDNSRQDRENVQSERNVAGSYYYDDSTGYELFNPEAQDEDDDAFDP